MSGVRCQEWLTPAGVAAVAVLALHGARAVASPLCDRRGRALPWPAGGEWRVAWLLDATTRAPLDEVVVLGTASGVELHLHGGPGVGAAVAARLAALGFPACSASVRPPAAVAPAGCPDALVPNSLRAARALVSASHGALAQLEAHLQQDPSAADAGTRAALRETLARSVLARRLQHPPCVRLVGRPNVGKSSLFNRLLRDERALVSPEAGTTRDPVQALTTWLGVPVQLEDSAGSDGLPPVAPGADLYLHLLEAPDEPPLSPPRGAPVLRILGKADRHGAPGVSGLTGLGVPGLVARLAAALGLPGEPDGDALTPILDAQRERLRASWDRALRQADRTT